MYIAAAARGISVCGDILAVTALALTFQSQGAGGLAVSGLWLAATLPIVVLAPLSGRLVDRVDSRALLVAAGFGQAAVCAALAFVGHPAAVIALVGVLAAGLSVTQPTLAALLPEMVGRDDLPRATAINQTARGVGAVVAPALAGLLVGQFGVRVPLLIDAASYLAIVAAGLLLRTRRGGRLRVSEVASDGRRTEAAWRLTADPLLRATMISLAAVIGALGAINVVIVFFVREALDASTTVYGVVQASWTAGMLAGAWLLVAAARRARDDGALVHGLLVQLGACCAVILATALVNAPGWLVPLWLIGGALNGGINLFQNQLMASRVPPAYRGRGFATLGAAVNGAMLGGFLAGGVILAYVEPRPIVAGLGIVGLAVVALLVLPVLRTVRRERAAAADTQPETLPMAA